MEDLAAKLETDGGLWRRVLKVGGNILRCFGEVLRKYERHAACEEENAGIRL
jgi:hypothetical protein